MSHLDPSETKISEGLRPVWLYSFWQIASLSGAFPCSAPYLQAWQHLLAPQPDMVFTLNPKPCGQHSFKVPMAC